MNKTLLDRGNIIEFDVTLMNKAITKKERPSNKQTLVSTAVVFFQQIEIQHSHNSTHPKESTNASTKFNCVNKAEAVEMARRGGVLGESFFFCLTKHSAGNTSLTI